jgi:sulfate permease, SulP family
VRRGRLNVPVPRLVACLRHYSWRTFGSDALAGVTVGFVALPLAMAFAIASGLSPQSGLYCAIVAGGLISLFGGSRVQIGGPTGAFVVIVAGIATRYGVDGLFMCTMLAGGILIALGVTGMGSAIRFIPRPVVVGFTNGIAVLIASTQIRDFFGLKMASVPSEFLPRMRALLQAAGTWSPAATALSVAALVCIIVAARISRRIPGSIIVLVAATLAVVTFGLNVETIGTRFGGVPGGLPAFRMPQFHLATLGALVMPAVTVAMLGAIESLMSATVADRLSGDRHDPNVELVAQGIANIASPLVGGLPATGAIARTATNVRSGARTPVAGIIHAITLLLILLFAAPLARYIPLAVLSAILLFVAYNMGEWREIPELLRLTKTDVTVWIVTFELTVFTDLTIAVSVGMALAALLFIRRVVDTTTVSPVTDEYVREGHVHSLQTRSIPRYVKIFRIHGPFLFGTTDKLHVVYDHLNSLPEIVVLRLRNMTALDATGLRAIEELAVAMQQSGRCLILCGARHQPARLIARADFHRHVGDANICANLHDALERAAVVHNERQSKTVSAREASA